MQERYRYREGEDDDQSIDNPHGEKSAGLWKQLREDESHEQRFRFGMNTNHCARQGQERETALRRVDRALLEETEAEAASVGNLQAEARERARNARNRARHARQKRKKQLERAERSHNQGSIN